MRNLPRLAGIGSRALLVAGPLRRSCPRLTPAFFLARVGQIGALVIVGLVTLCITSGCQVDRSEGILMAAGGYGEVAVAVSDNDLRPMVEGWLSRLNRPELFVIKEEPPFAVDVYSGKKWKLGRNYKNIIFITRWGDGGSVQKEVARLLSDETLARMRSGQGGLAQMKDPYARYQFALFASAADRNSLASLLNRSSERIREMLETENRERIRERFRNTGLHEEIMPRYWQKFGFWIELPREYREEQSEPQEFSALEWMRTSPPRGITVAWKAVVDTESALLDRDSLLEWRREMGRVVHDEQLEDVSLEWSDVDFRGQTCLRLSGAWSGQTFDGGGPFWSFFLADQQGRRLFCIDMLTYAPSEDKMPYFREMQAIAESFSLKPPSP